MAASTGNRALMLAVVVVPLTAGCASWDRESYSLIIRKPAHRYHPPPAGGALPTDAPPELSRIPAGSPGSPLTAPEDIEALIGREAFRPFTYCYEHESSHVPESLVAMVAAPVEYPLALTGTLTSQAVQGTLRYLEGWLALLFPRAPEPEESPPAPTGR